MDIEMREIKDHLVHISAQLLELQVGLRRLEEHSKLEAAFGVATALEMDCAVAEAIRQTRANSRRQLDIVLRAACAPLESKAFDRTVLLDLIRQKLPDS